MSSNTPNLALYKKNPITDGSDTFNVVTMLNDNWDKIDTASGNKVDKVAGKQLSSEDFTAAEKTKLTGIASGANNYTHPANHPPAVITQDASNRFVSDTEKAAWNAKQAALGYTPLNKAGDTATNLLLAGDPMVPLGAVTRQFAEINFPKMSTANVTYYVLKTGSDSNTGLANTAGGAFLTIAKATSMIPQVVNHTYTINVGVGTYAEDVSFNGFTGNGTIRLLGAGAVLSDSYVINSATIRFCDTVVIVQGFKAITTGNAFLGFVSTSANFDFCKTDVSALASYACRFDGCSASVSNCYFSNRFAAIDAETNSRVYSINNIGTGNSNGLASRSASIIGKSGAQATATTPEVADTGGVITGGVINPWGDNTLFSRSLVILYPTLTTYSVAANTLTKVAYDLLNTDGLGEYVPASKYIRFKAKRLVLVEAATLITDATLGDKYQLYIYLNGNQIAPVTEVNYSAAGGVILRGQKVVLVNTNDYLEIYIYSIASGARTLSATFTSLIVTQIA